MVRIRLQYWRFLYLQWFETNSFFQVCAFFFKLTFLKERQTVQSVHEKLANIKEKLEKNVPF